MPKKLEEITATWDSEEKRFPSAGGDCLIGKATRHQDGGEVGLKIKCNEEDEHPEPWQTYRFYGAWSNYTNKHSGAIERQFHAKTFVQCQPHSRAGIITYLGKAPGIGRILAGRLWDKFSGNAVKMLREKPDVAAASVDMLSEPAAIEAAKWLEREKGLEDCTIDLIDLLDGRGFPKGVYKQAVKLWGNTAAQKIQENPYRLMAFRGCGFKRADHLYLDTGHPPAALKRQALCVWYSIASQSSGDTWHYIEVAKRSLEGSIGGADVRVGPALQLSVRGRLLSALRTNGVNGLPYWDGTHLWLADARKSRNERRLAKLVARAMNDPVQWPDISSAKESLQDEDGGYHQYDVLSKCLVTPLAILGGSPGTGKTFTAAQLVRMLLKEFGADQIGVACPTGKAAVRMTEAMNEYKLPLRATTIHSMLGVLSAEDGWSFEHGPDKPLPFKVLILDEISMLDVDLAASLFAARCPGTLVLLIGDINQLPPVGHGAPLRDMIAAGVPYGELKKIRRNSGAIVEACAQIRDGQPFDMPDGGNLVGIPGDAETLIGLITSTQLQSQVKDIVWDVQVLCAVNKKSALSRSDLNKLLQNHLNPNPAIKGSPFRLADKAVNTKNGWFPIAEQWLNTNDRKLGDGTEQVILNEDGKVYVANGELGQIVEVQPKFFIATLTSPFRAIIVPRGVSTEAKGEDDDSDDESNATGTGCNWDLGYALSVHKSQGSQWPAVIVMIDDSAAAARVCSREWLYTSVSRAMKCCYLIGNNAVAQGFIRRTALDKRKTFLTHFIREELSCLLS